LGAFQGRDGTVWHGTAERGLWRARQGTLTSFTITNGLSSNTAAVAHEDESGALWILTQQGLIRLKEGHFAKLGLREGLPSEVLLSLLEDDLGNYWFNSHQGIFRLPKQELNEVADSNRPAVQAFLYGTADGAPALEGNASGIPNSCRDSEGQLWFPTIGGVVVVDPKSAMTYDLPPPVHIEHVQADDLTLLSGPEAFRKDGHPVKIPPGHGNGLTFRYTAIDFKAPDKLDFKYRLDGRDTGWIEAGNQRFAVYSGLPPGPYVFRVKARNARGIWNESGASFAFTLMPFFYQTWTFRILSAVALLAFAAALVRYRFNMERRVLRLEQAAALARERERIARDLHDDLGSSLTRIAMLSEIARRQPQGEEKSIERVATISRGLVDSIGELVWATNPKYDNLDGMAAYFRQYAAQFIEPFGIAFRFETSGEPLAGAVNAELRRELFLVLKEALNNVAKHAQAREVALGIHVHHGVLQLLVADNGSGMSEVKERAFHQGLANMRQRIGRLNGAFRIESAPGKGTIITASVPLPFVRT
jgi:signal transduction histidine kinase